MHHTLSRLAAVTALLVLVSVPAGLAGPAAATYPEPVGAAAVPQSPVLSSPLPSEERAQDPDGNYVFPAAHYPKPVGTAAKN